MDSTSCLLIYSQSELNFDQFKSEFGQIICFCSGPASSRLQQRRHHCLPHTIFPTGLILREGFVGSSPTHFCLYLGPLPRCHSVSVPKAPSAPAAAPVTESLHASTAFARVTGWNNHLQHSPRLDPRVIVHACDCSRLPKGFLYV